MQLREVQTKADWSEFIDFPWQIYKKDSVWVPPLKIAVKDQLDVKKHPFFQHAEMLPLLAMDGTKCVGRLIGVIDRRNNEFHNEKTAFFGFFECIDDPKVAHLLVNKVKEWATAKGMTALRGPFNPSSNYECGLLVEGFDDPPSVMMTYNPPYYGRLLEECGLVKTKDLFAYELDKNLSKFSERIFAQSERLKQSKSVTFRAIRFNDFENEIQQLLAVYNDAWEKNWGFVPFTTEEFRLLAKELKMIADPELCLIAEIRGEVVGFSLALPDANQAIQKVRNGKLLPFGIFKLLWNLKGPGKKKTIDRCRIILVGVKRQFREYSLGPLFYTEYFKRGPALGYPRGEASWILEDNKPMNRALQYMSAKKTKTYRIYERSLTES